MNASTTPAAAALPGVLRSIAIACRPDTVAADALVGLATASEVTVRDGSRWTAYSTPDVSVALAGPDELPSGATASLNVKVTDVRSAIATLVAAGADPCGEITQGGHEVRASVWLSDSVALTLYQPA